MVMSRLRFLTVAALALVFFSWKAEAQVYSYGIDAELDTQAENAIRARMDSIRMSRPTVALVLSGGGAKGAAHVGVLKYLEEINMPVDIVLGTSMGGLVGGLYSVGLGAGQLDSLIRTLDWDLELSDKVPVSYLPYSEKMYKRKYQISIPFYYSKREYERQKKLDGHFQHMVREMDELHLGAEDGNGAADRRDNIRSSLPSGFVYGQNVNNLFSSLTVGYQDEMPFWELPIPFVCVATEMVTAKEKVWYSGKLNTALRSTMSIPGLFTPVKTDGMVLIDGGMRNNYPADIAKRLGADLIIGVDLSSGYMEYDEINNITDILMQSIDMFGRPSYENNISIPDVTIKPDIEGYNMMSFDTASIDTLIARGEDAARKEADKLLAIKEAVGPDSLKLQDRPAVNLITDKVLVEGVEFYGVDEDESRYLMEHLKISPGQVLGSREIEDAVAAIYGTKTFDYISYELLGEEEPYRLRFNCKKGPIHNLRVGGRLDTDEILSVIVNLGLNVHSVRGHALETMIKIGENPAVGLHYSYKSVKGPSANISLDFRHVSDGKLSLDDDSVGFDYYSFNLGAYLSNNIKWNNLNFNIGARAKSYNLNSYMASNFTSLADMDAAPKNMFLSVFLDGGADTFDNGYFPSRGFSMKYGYSFVFAGVRESIDPVQVVNFDFKTVAYFGKSVSLLPFANLIFLLGDQVPAGYANVIGGSLAGRYVDQQIAFMGITDATLVPRLLAVTGAELRVKVLKNNYLSAIMNVGDSASDFVDMLHSDSFLLGAGLQYSYNSIVGPIRANIHWSSITKSVGAYLGIGFDF